MEACDFLLLALIETPIRLCLTFEQSGEHSVPGKGASMPKGMISDCGTREILINNKRRSSGLCVSSGHPSRPYQETTSKKEI